MGEEGAKAPLMGRGAGSIGFTDWQPGGSVGRIGL